jgi:polar amino acid transport system ATP-binding protein
MDFARDVSNRVFYMDEGTIYEAGTPLEIFEHPRKEKTRAFINRIRSFNRRIVSVDFDRYALYAEIEQFCEKQILPRSARQNLLLLVDELLQIHQPRLRHSAVDLTIASSEKSGRLELIVESDGTGGDPLAIAAADNELALALIRGFSEAIDYRPVGGRSRLELVVRKS